MNEKSVFAYNWGDSFSGIDSSKGLSKRELFAAIALNGILSNSFDSPNDIGAKSHVQLAISYADALIKELAKDS